MGNVPEKIIARSVPDFEFHSHVLIVGGGADNTILELIRNKKCERITHIDISKVLSSKANIRLQQEGLESKIEVDYIVKDFLSMESEIEFDAVVFPFYLDLFLDFEIEENIQNAKQLLQPNGSIYIIDFSSSTESSFWQKMKEIGLYKLFYPVTKTSRNTFPNYRFLFEKNGFKQKRSQQFKNGFYVFAEYQVQ